LCAQKVNLRKKFHDVICNRFRPVVSKMVQDVF
jgi:hypothetical protein